MRTWARQLGPTSAGSARCKICEAQLAELPSYSSRCPVGSLDLFRYPCNRKERPLGTCPSLATPTRTMISRNTSLSAEDPQTSHIPTTQTRPSLVLSERNFIMYTAEDIGLVLQATLHEARILSTYCLLKPPPHKVRNPALDRESNTCELRVKLSFLRMPRRRCTSEKPARSRLSHVEGS